MMPFSVSSRGRAIVGFEQFVEIAQILNSAVIRNLLDRRVASSQTHCRVFHPDAIHDFRGRQTEMVPGFAA